MPIPPSPEVQQGKPPIWEELDKVFKMVDKGNGTTNDKLSAILSSREALNEILTIFLSVKPIDRTYFLEFTLVQWATYKLKAQNRTASTRDTIAFANALSRRLAVMLAGEFEHAQMTTAPAATAKAVREKVKLSGAGIT